MSRTPKRLPGEIAVNKAFIGDAEVESLDRFGVKSQEMIPRSNIFFPLSSCPALITLTYIKIKASLKDKQN